MNRLKCKKNIYIVVKDGNEELYSNKAKALKEFNKAKKLNQYELIELLKETDIRGCEDIITTYKKEN